MRVRVDRVRAGLPILLAAIVAAQLLAATAAEADSPPPAVSAVTVTRGDGTLTAAWGAAAGATSYHVTYSSDGGSSWSLAAYAHASTSITINHVLNASTYIVGVRARNAAGGSGWVNSPAAGPHTPATPVSPPATPSSVNVTRGEATLNVSWPAVAGATSYHVTYTNAGGDRGWVLAAHHHLTNSITINHVLNMATYIVGVRARNSAGDSGWRNSPETGYYYSTVPVPERPASVTLARTNGSITATWPAVEHATGYHVGYSDDLGASFHRLETSYTSTSITFDAHNGRPYYVGVMAINGAGDSGWRDSEVSHAITPSQPTSVSVARTDGALTATWPAAPMAASYHVTYSGDGGVSWSLGAYGHTSTSLEISGVDNAKTYIVGVRSMNNVGGSKWRNSPAAGPYTGPPSAPANLAVAPGDGFLGITWDAVASATGYDIRAKSQGASNWHDVASAVTGTSYNYATTTTMDYVAVRARNANGASDWSEVSRLPPSELLSTASGLENSGGGAMAMAMSGGGQSEVSAQSNQVSGQSKLSRPIWSDIDRGVNRFKTEIDLNWTHTGGWATGFNLVCSDTDGWTWNVCGWDNNGTTTYTSVPTSESKPVTVTHYRRGSDSPHTPGDYDLAYARHYTVAIRAVNANPSQASDWVRTEIIRPIFGYLRNLTVARTDGQITLSWTPNPWTTGYEIHCDDYTSGGTYSPTYTRCATLTNQDHNDASHSVTLTSWTAGGTSYSIDNTSTWDIKIVSTNSTGRAEDLAPLIYSLPAAPTSVTYATSTNTLTWTPPTDTGNGPNSSALKYNVYCRQTSTETWTKVIDKESVPSGAGPHTKTLTDTKCTQTNSQVEIAIVNVYEGLRAHASAATLGAPTGVNAQYHWIQNRGNQFRAWWTRPTGWTGDLAYELECSTDAGTNWTNCATLAHTGDTDFLVSPSNTGVNKVQARASRYGKNSAWAQSDVAANYSGPAAVTSLAVAKATSGANVTYTVSFTKPAGETGAIGYKVWCEDTWGSGYMYDCADIAATSDSSVSTTITRTTSARAFTEVLVEPYDGNLQGAWTSITGAELPTGVAAAYQTGGNLKVTWSHSYGSANASNFTVECTTQPFSPYNGNNYSACTGLGTPTLSSGTWEVTSSQASVTGVRVRASATTTGGLGISPWANAIAVPASSQGQVGGQSGSNAAAGLSVTRSVEGGTASYSASWSRPAGASGAVAYALGCSTDGVTWTACATVAATTAATLTATITQPSSAAAWTHVRVKPTAGASLTAAVTGN